MTTIIARPERVRRWRILLAICVLFLSALIAQLALTLRGTESTIASLREIGVKDLDYTWLTDDVFYYVKPDTKTNRATLATYDLIRMKSTSVDKLNVNAHSMQLISASPTGRYCVLEVTDQYGKPSPPVHEYWLHDVQSRLAWSKLLTGSPTAWLGPENLCELRNGITDSLRGTVNDTAAVSSWPACFDGKIICVGPASNQVIRVFWKSTITGEYYLSDVRADSRTGAGSLGTRISVPPSVHVISAALARNGKIAMLYEQATPSRNGWGNWIKIDLWFHRATVGYSIGIANANRGIFSRLTALEGIGSESQDQAANRILLQWLPSGRAISFVNRGALVKIDTSSL